jgi:hypothetical protein
MKKLLLGMVLLAWAIAVPLPAMAGIGISVNIGLPPPIGFAAPPDMIVLPGTYVYVVPDTDVDIFFYDGWWWRPWEGRWYRSRYYDRGWGYYRRVPRFYRDIPPGWRNDYRDHRWGGREWNYQRVPHERVQRNWRTWQRNNYWQHQQSWGVQGFQPRPRPARAAREAGPQRPAAQPRGIQPQRSPQSGREPGAEPKGVIPQHPVAQPRAGQPPQSPKAGREPGMEPQGGKPPQPVAQPRAGQPQQSPKAAREVQSPRSPQQHREGGAQPREGKKPGQGQE